MGNLIGRSRRVRQGKVYLELLLAVAVVCRGRLAERFPHVRWLNSCAQRLQPWQIFVGAWGLSHLLSNLFLLLGFDAPHSSLYTEPDCHYTPSFTRVRYLLTGLDAGFLSALRVRNTTLRNVLSVLLACYYLVFSRRAENKVQAFRRSLPIESIVSTWEKGSHPLFRFFSWLGLPKLRMRAVPIHIPRDPSARSSACLHEDRVFSQRVPGSCVAVAPLKPPAAHEATDDDDAGTIECRLWFDGSRRRLRREHRLVLQFHGGGFVSQTPLHHEDYLAAWAKALRVPILSVNYRKAPQFPFPAGFDDCMQVYRQLVESDGHLIGMNMPDDDDDEAEAEEGARLRVVLVGDSAGGNLVAGVAYRALEHGLPKPAAVHMIYPALDLDGDMWRPQSVHPSSVTSNACRGGDGARPPEMSSKARYAFDGVLPLKYLLVIGQAYLRNGGDPQRDPRLSPLRAGHTDILAKFPPVYVHVGAVDPLVDDSVNFVYRLQKAKHPHSAEAQLRVFRGVSHAYMHVIHFLDVGNVASRLSMQWIAEALDVPMPQSLRVTEEELSRFCVPLSSFSPFDPSMRQLHADADKACSGKLSDDDTCARSRL